MKLVVYPDSIFFGTKSPDNTLLNFYTDDYYIYSIYDPFLTHNAPYTGGSRLVSHICIVDGSKKSLIRTFYATCPVETVSYKDLFIYEWNRYLADYF